eukprot:m.136249 g.136249  ORF g.136249 m.136249 type:complete len:645 (-) comp16579_c0_seq1:1185-3119(-)
MSTSILEAVRIQFLNNLFGPLREESERQIAAKKQKDPTAKIVFPYRPLIVDQVALRVLSSVFTMSEIVAEGVSVVEDITKGRQPMPTCEAIYLCAPTDRNVSYINKDFSPDAPEKQYLGIHVFFLDDSSKVIGKFAPETKKVLRSLKELYLSFDPIEELIFTVDDPEGFYNAYSPNGNFNVDHTCSMLAAVCATLEDYPVVRYQKESRLGGRISGDLQARLDDMAKANVIGHVSSRKRSQLIILDRGFDVISPLVHELTYQAATVDLLNINDGQYKYDYEDSRGAVSKVCLLDEKDFLWRRFRHDHISYVYENITKAFREFRKEKEAITAKTAGAADKDSVKDLKEVLKKIPQHQELATKYGVHLDLATKLNKAFTKKIEKCINAEQNMVMHENGDGVKVRDFLEEIASIIPDSGISVENKLRALMLCILSQQGIKEADLNGLFESGSIPPAKRDIVKNMAHLGVPVVVSKVKPSKLPARPARDLEFNLSRWTPLLKDLLEEAVDGKLSATDYPGKDAVPIAGDEDDDGPAQSARKSYGGWAQNKGKKGERKSESKQKTIDNHKPRVIVFVIGCIGYNEMRVAYEVARAKPECDIYLGSHMIATPVKFLDLLSQLTHVQKAAPVDDSARRLTFVAGQSVPEMRL